MLDRCLVVPVGGRRLLLLELATVGDVRLMASCCCWRLNCRRTCEHRRKNISIYTNKNKLEKNPSVHTHCVWRYFSFSKHTHTTKIYSICWLVCSLPAPVLLAVVLFWHREPPVELSPPNIVQPRLGRALKSSIFHVRLRCALASSDAALLRSPASAIPSQINMIIGILSLEPGKTTLHIWTGAIGASDTGTIFFWLVNKKKEIDNCGGFLFLSSQSSEYAKAHCVFPGLWSLAIQTDFKEKTHSQSLTARWKRTDNQFDSTCIRAFIIFLAQEWISKESDTPLDMTKEKTVTIDFVVVVCCWRRASLFPPSLSRFEKRCHRMRAFY